MSENKEEDSSGGGTLEGTSKKGNKRESRQKTKTVSAAEDRVLLSRLKQVQLEYELSFRSKVVPALALSQKVVDLLNPNPNSHAEDSLFKKLLEIVNTPGASLDKLTLFLHKRRSFIGTRRPYMNTCLTTEIGRA